MLEVYVALGLKVVSFPPFSSNTWQYEASRDLPDPSPATKTHKSASDPRFSAVSCRVGKPVCAYCAVRIRLIVLAVCVCLACAFAVFGGAGHSCAIRGDVDLGVCA